MQLIKELLTTMYFVVSFITKLYMIGSPSLPPIGDLKSRYASMVVGGRAPVLFCTSRAL